MSEPDVGPVPSLIQQRLALSRRRSHALYTLLSSAVIAAGWVMVVVFDGNDVVRWLSAIVFGFIAIYGIIDLRRAQRDIRAFEEQNGVGAGVQKPVR